MSTESLAKINRWLDAALPLISVFGLGAVQVKAIYDAFRGTQPKDVYPELSAIELSQLLEHRAQLFVAAVLADKAAVAQR